MQPDGKILIVNSDAPSSLHRLNADGSLDTTFDDPFVPFSASIQKRTRITTIALLPDGKILVGGAFTKLGNLPRTGAARLVPGAAPNVRFDFDGDGQADIAVYRGGTWHFLHSSSGYAAANFGLAADRLVPADFDGDGRTNIAVFREGVWYYLNNTGGAAIQHFGLSSDEPVQAAFVQ